MKKPDIKNQRRVVVREYTGVHTLLKELFGVPENEYIKDFEWNKQEGLLVLTTIKDFNDKEGDL